MPVFVLSTSKGKHRWTGANRQQFLCGCLSSLAQNLGAVGGRLVIRSGKAVEELAKLALETRARAIFFNRDPDPFGRWVEAELIAFGQQAGIEIVGSKDATIREGNEVLTSSGEPFRVDAAAYFRILNPWTQSARIDPDGEYIKKWIPQLRGVPARRFFEPPALGERLAAGYPTPIVDHARAREKALELFGQYGGAHAARV